MLSTGEFAPDFELPQLGGTPVSLSRLLQQGSVLLAFFKVSCPTCQLTLPFLDRLRSKDTLRVYGVSQDSAGPSDDFRARFGISYPILLDSVEHGYPVSNAYKLTNVPSMFVVEPGNLIRWASNGFLRADLEQLAREHNAPLFRPEDRVPEWKPG